MNDPVKQSGPVTQRLHAALLRYGSIHERWATSPARARVPTETGLPAPSLAGPHGKSTQLGVQVPEQFPRSNDAPAMPAAAAFGADRDARGEESAPPADDGPLGGVSLAHESVPAQDDSPSAAEGRPRNLTLVGLPFRAILRSLTSTTQRLRQRRAAAANPSAPEWYSYPDQSALRAKPRSLRDSSPLLPWIAGIGGVTLLVLLATGLGRPWRRVEPAPSQRPVPVRPALGHSQAPPAAASTIEKPSPLESTQPLPSGASGSTDSSNAEFSAPAQSGAKAPELEAQPPDKVEYPDNAAGGRANPPAAPSEGSASAGKKKPPPSRPRGGIIRQSPF